MEYSKIKSVEVENFMAYENGKILFDDKNVINLKGYNGSGKSTMLRAIATCLMNMYPREQVKFIRHGAEYSRVIVSFDDGVVILHDKYLNGQSLYEMYKDNECIFTTKVGNKLTRIDGVPAIIENYLGLLHTSNGGYLNYQTREDPLFLAETKGSENYSDVNEILKSEELSRANSLLNSDKNKLGGEIASIEQDIQQAEMYINNYRDVSQELIDVLQAKEEHIQMYLARLNVLDKVRGVIGELSIIADLPEISLIEKGRLGAINTLGLCVSSIDTLKDVPKVERVDTRKLSAIKSLSAVLDNAYSLKDGFTAEMSVIPLDKYKDLAVIYREFQKLSTIIKEDEELKTIENSLQDKRDNIMSEASKHGIKYVVCENCGTLMEVR